MKLLTRYLAPLCCIALAASTAHAQALLGIKLHNVGIGGNAIGQFTPQITSEGAGALQTTTDSFGGEFTLRASPVAWAGLEFNYAYTDFHEKFALTTSYTTVKTDMHEATAAYLFHPHFRKLQPFLAVGGGYIDFVPAVQGSNQWRGTGLFELGFDIPTSNPHMGFRIQDRTLVYRDPQFYAYTFGNENWVATEEPSVGAWYRW